MSVANQTEDRVYNFSGRTPKGKIRLSQRGRKLPIPHFLGARDCDYLVLPRQDGGAVWVTDGHIAIHPDIAFPVGREGQQGLSVEYFYDDMLKLGAYGLTPLFDVDLSDLEMNPGHFSRYEQQFRIFADRGRNIRSIANLQYILAVEEAAPGGEWVTGKGPEDPLQYVIPDGDGVKVVALVQVISFGWRKREDNAMFQFVKAIADHDDPGSCPAVLKVYNKTAVAV